MGNKLQMIIEELDMVRAKLNMFLAGENPSISDVNLLQLDLAYETIQCALDGLNLVYGDMTKEKTDEQSGQASTGDGVSVSDSCS